MSARDKLAGIEAMFWDCHGSELLTHEDPISALEDCIDSHLYRGCDTEKEIREMGAISVDAYVRKVVTDRDIEDFADRALETICEALDDDEYGHPDGDRNCIDKAAQEKHRPAFLAVTRALIADAKVWQCEVKQSVVLTPDEVLEIMRVERPDWFQPEPTP